MSKREMKAYKKGQADMATTMISLLVCTGLFIVMIIKSGMYVM